MNRIAKYEDIEEISRIKILQQKDDWQEIYPSKDEELYQVTKSYLEEHLNKDIFFFVEIIKNKIIATCGLQIIKYMPQCVESGIEGYICDVFTLKEYRKKGIQTNLMKQCIKFAKENDIIELKLSSDNPDAIRLYKNLGFKYDKLIMKKELGTELKTKDNERFTTSNLKNIFERASKLFLKEQYLLILSGVSERCWYTQLAMYFVASEYKRNDKKIKTICYSEEELKVIKVTCDIIVHSRGDNIEQDNLICIEMKKSTAKKASKIADKTRLRTLTKDSFDDVWSYDGKTLPEHVCRYKLGVYYEINIKEQKVHIEYYQKGEKSKEYDIKF